MYILLTAVLCAVLCYGIVYPLWLFATSSSHLYTVLIITAAVACLLIMLAVRFIRRYKAFTSQDERKKFCLKRIFTLLILLVLAAALVFSILLVLAGNRIAALILLLSGIAAAVVLHKLKARYTDV